jgi:hypothetical protein
MDLRIKTLKDLRDGTPGKPFAEVPINRYERILARHESGCGCWDCVIAITAWISETVITKLESEMEGRVAEFTLRMQIKAVEREIALRTNVYPRQVAASKMSQADADMHVREMRAVLQTLQWLETNREKITSAVKGLPDGIHGSAKADGASAGVGNPPPDVSGDGGKGTDHAG